MLPFVDTDEPVVQECPRAFVRPVSNNRKFFDVLLSVSTRLVGLGVDCSSWVQTGYITPEDQMDRSWVYWTTFCQVRLLFRLDLTFKGGQRYMVRMSAGLSLLGESTASRQHPRAFPSHLRRWICLPVPTLILKSGPLVLHVDS